MDHSNLPEETEEINDVMCMSCVMSCACPFINIVLFVWSAITHITINIITCIKFNYDLP